MKIPPTYPTEASISNLNIEEELGPNLIIRKEYQNLNWLRKLVENFPVLVLIDKVQNLDSTMEMSTGVHPLRGCFLTAIEYVLNNLY